VLASSANSSSSLGMFVALAWATAADMVHCEFGAPQKGYISVQVQFWSIG
jgi:hypothetical protein